MRGQRGACGVPLEGWGASQRQGLGDESKLTRLRAEGLMEPVLRVAVRMWPFRSGPASEDLGHRSSGQGGDPGPGADVQGHRSSSG